MKEKMNNIEIKNIINTANGDIIESLAIDGHKIENIRGLKIDFIDWDYTNFSAFQKRHFQSRISITFDANIDLKSVFSEED